MAGMLKNLPAASAGKITAQSVRAQMHLTPVQAKQLDRIVLAGMKVMFDAKTHQLMLDQLNGPGVIAQKIGQGVAGLMGMLMQESKGSIPGQLLIPAGMILVCKAAEFLNGSGQSVSDQDIGNAMEVMATAILHAGGIDPDKLAAAGAAQPAGAKP